MKSIEYIKPKSWDKFRKELFESFWGIKYNEKIHKHSIINKL